MKESKEAGKVHLVGIGGIGVSALARYFLSKGWDVSGSDASDHPELRGMGVRIFKGHSEKNVPEDLDILVYSPAVPEDNPEIVKAETENVRVLSYPQALGEITERYYTVAVSGTHGKSTTTSMIALALEEAGFDPTVIVGTKLKEFGGTNFKKGNSSYLVIEADEFKAALLNYSSDVAVVTNIEEDHLDFYKDIDDIISTFKKYTKENLNQEGCLIINEDDENAPLLKKVFPGKVARYSLKDEETKELNLSIPGRHNLSNALAAWKACLELGAEKEKILKALSAFTGTWRRFEEKDVVTEKGEVRIINDYAHHPTELKSTLQAAREKYPREKLVAVFQPHQYERTYHLFEGLRKAISSAETDEFLITDIYTVKGRESEDIKRRVSARMLCEKTKNASYAGSLRDTKKKLLKVLQGGEVVVIMGAGDVGGLERMISKF